jgi:hypothetical protein
MRHGRRHQLAIAALAAVVACVGPVASASADRAPALRYQTHARGDLATAGNTLLTCPVAVAACGPARAGTGGSRQNNNYAMQYVDVDADPGTFNSSSARLELPAGATVTFAGLYWGADTSAGSGGAAAPAPALVSAALLDTPAPGGYADVTGSQHDDASAAWPGRYQEFADVTERVAAAGAGEYTLANVQAGTGTDRYGGWALIVAYRAAGEPIRNLSVFDGLVTIQNTMSTDLTIDGFETPGAGVANASLGLVTYEGDYGISGDGLALNGMTVSDAVNGATNFFNSSVSDRGTRVSAKSPNYVDQLGFDLDRVDVGGQVGAGATSADLHLTTNGDTYFVGAVTLTTDQVPEAPLSTSAPALSGAAADERTLTATPGTWSGTAPMDFTYQWQRCDAAGGNCVDIPGATGSTYLLGDDDVGATVRAVVTATNEVGSSSATSAVSGVVAPAAPSLSSSPAVGGPPLSGGTLTADPGPLAGTGPFEVDYQWQQCDASGGNCVDIPGANGPSYELTPEDVGHTIVVVITVTNEVGTVSVTSPPSAVIAAAPGAGDEDVGAGPLGGAALAPARCQIVTGTQVLAFEVPGAGRFRIRVAPSGVITAARPLRAAAPLASGGAWRLTRHVRRVVYRLGGRRIAVRRRAPWTVRIGPGMLRRAERQTLTVRVVPRRGKPRVARVQLTSKPCSQLFTVVHRPSPRRSLLGLRVDSVSSLRRLVFRVPVRLLARRGERGVAGKLRVRVPGRGARNYRLSFPRRRGRATTLLAGAGRPQVRVTGGRIVVSGLPAGVGGIRLRLRARGMLATPRTTLRAVIESDAGSRRLTQRLGKRR